MTPSSELSFETRTALNLCEAIGSPRALTVKLLIESNEWSQLVDLEPHFGVTNPTAFCDDYLVTEVLKKTSNLPLGVDRKKVALLSFMDSEFNCYQTNERLLMPGLKPLWFYQLRDMIHAILGPLRKKDLETVADCAKHGPGVVVGLRGAGSVPSDKFDKECTLTAELIPFARSLMGETWANHAEKRVVPGGNLSCVPKNAKTDRTICTEPNLNAFVQAGIGTVLRRRLKRFGVDLQNQGINAALARRAYQHGLSTIDLKSASDSVSTVLVEQLLSDRWFSLLDLTRSKVVMLPDKTWWRIQKFSAMGNGFTFPLESLVFSALAFTTVPAAEWVDVGVYGDDIIVPRAYADLLIDRLKFLGFETNTKKSHLAGDFFESCGSDYYRGVAVRPFYLRRSDDGKNEDGSPQAPYPVRASNMIRAYARRDGLGIFCHKRFLRPWMEAFLEVPLPFRTCIVPSHLGDAGVWGPRADAQVEKPDGGEQGWVIPAVLTKDRKIRKRTVGRHLAALARIGTSDAPASKGLESRRMSTVFKFQPSSVLVSHWDQGWEWGPF